MSDKRARAAHLNAEIRRLQLELQELELGTNVGTSDEDSRRSSTRSVRVRVLDALEDLGIPTLTRVLQVFIGSMTGVYIDPTRFGSLRRAEMEAFSRSRAHAVFIAYGLTDKGEAIKRLLGRSDWQLADRVIAPTTGRLLHLRLTARLCEIALEQRERIADWPTFQMLIADHARDLPGVPFVRGEFPIEMWRSRALELLFELQERDRENRAAIARRLSAFCDPRTLVFGTEKQAPDTRIQPPITEVAES